jgi:hypothetical protein
VLVSICTPLPLSTLKPISFCLRSSMVFDEIFQVPAEAIKFPDHQCYCPAARLVNRSLAQGDHLSALKPSLRKSFRRHSRLNQSIVLKIQALGSVLFGNPHVTDEH